MSFHRSFAAALLASLVLVLPSVALACDLCAVYSADQAAGQESTGFYVGVSEQFTRYDRLSEEGHRVREDGGQYLNSSITQLLLGYGLTDRLSAQISLPYIDRRFSRPEGTETDRGTVSGLGDLNVIAQYTAWRHDSEAWTASLRLLAGLKLPTGDSDRIAEELSEEEGGEGIPSGIHGHDIALGTGSLDYIFGGGISGRSGRWLARADAQYALRTRGDFDYRYGDDIQWNLGAGRYLLLEEGRSLALNLNLSGEYKHFDNIAGERPDDTQSRVLFLGPQLSGSFGSRYSAELRADFPIEDYGSSIQTLPAFRIRLSLLARF